MEDIISCPVCNYDAVKLYIDEAFVKEGKTLVVRQVPYYRCALCDWHEMPEDIHKLLSFMRDDFYKQIHVNFTPTISIIKFPENKVL